MSLSPPGRFAILTVAAAAWASGPAFAQPGPATPGTATLESAAAAEKAEERSRREGALKDLQEEFRRSDESRRRLAAEITELRTDNARLGAALVAAGTRVRAAEDRMSVIEARLTLVQDSETAMRRSLDARRDLLGEVLAALQRMGRNPPPALLVRPDDILAAIRTAMLLGVLTPALREETETLGTDLAELVRLRGLAVADRARLDAEVRDLDGERERLAALLALRRDQIAAAESGLRQEKARADAIAREASSLRDLIGRLSGEIDAAARDAEDERRLADAKARYIRERFASAAVRDPVRLAPKIPFGEARGLLTRPAGGTVLRGFGAPDATGAPARGIVIGARAKALVTAPADAWVAYAGPFRSYGRLLILNAGDGYYVLLAGMDQVSVETGQFVLAGEPVGQMGETASSSAALAAVEAVGPVLYVEFRKDGGSIDPGPWWAKSQGEKVRG